MFDELSVTKAVALLHSDLFTASTFVYERTKRKVLRFRNRVCEEGKGRREWNRENGPLSSNIPEQPTYARLQTENIEHILELNDTYQCMRCRSLEGTPR